MVFVDFWNFQLSVNNIALGFKPDWNQLGKVFAREALRVVDDEATLSYQGMYIYGSYDPSSNNDERTRKWAMNTLDRYPGVQVTMLPRQRKRNGPVCPACHTELLQCVRCGSDMRGSEEKGVDTRIATDMIKFAWIDNYDIAVLLSSDRDFVPVIDFLDTRGIKTIHAAFPPSGSILTQRCWGNINVPSMIEKIRRK